MIGARIAERLGRSAPSVSQMLDRLVEDGYVTRDRRRLSLTDSGRALGEKVVRKHRLAERLLVDVIGLEWHKVHREAGRWEHVISDDVEARLVELLGDPATCPHGNPIPGSRSPGSRRRRGRWPTWPRGSGSDCCASARRWSSTSARWNCWTKGGSSPAPLPASAAATTRATWRWRWRAPPRCACRARALRPLVRRRPVTTRLEADAVFTVDDEGAVHQPGAVEIDGGVVSWIGDPLERPPAPGTRVERLGGIVMPGLVNCHAHSPMTLVRSAGDGLPLARWLSEAIWPREAEMRDEDVYWGMALGAVEMLTNGITTSCEQYRHPDPVTDALVDSGMRGVYTAAVLDLPDSPWEAFLAEACRVFDERDGREGRLHVGFGPHAAYTVPPEGLSATAAEARSRDALLQIHLSETEAEGALVEERYGARAPQLLCDLGVLEGRVLAAHAVWLDDADLELMARFDVAVAHCPGSNGKLGAGVAPLRTLLERRRAGRARHGRPGLERRPPPLGRDAPGRTPRPRHRGGPRCGDVGGGAAPRHPRRRRGARPPGRRAGARTPGRRHPPAHRRPQVLPRGRRGRAARTPRVGGRRLSRDGRMGGRGARRRGRALHARSTATRRAPRSGAAPAVCATRRLPTMSSFVDQAQLHARAGDGGAGAVSWRREAHVDRGGPDGGDGGHGGDVWLVASTNESSLLGFRDHPFRRATDGGHGSGQKRHGARGKDVEVRSPSARSFAHRDGTLVCDLAVAGARGLVAEGGQGGAATPGSSPTDAGRRRSPSRARRARSTGSTWSSSSWPTSRWSASRTPGSRR